MRPLRLEVEGFTSFRSQAVLDFTSLDLFAITGPTGAGKSSLLDAMLFALYGRTPRIGVNLNELIHQGANELRVLLEFSSGDEVYRLLRVLKRRGAATRRLEKREGDRWISVTASAADLKQQVVALTGLDFEGFTRAVILPQGEFDQFLRGDPKQRHEILSRLLHLEVYETMKVRAFDQAREAEMAAEAIRRNLDTVFEGVTEEALAECGVRLEEALVFAREAAARRDEAQRRLRLAKEYAASTALAGQRRAGVRDATQAFEQASQRTTQIQEKRLAVHETIREAEERMVRAGYDEAAYHRLIALRPVVQQHRTLVAEIETMRSRLARLERDLKESMHSAGTAEAAAEAAAEETRRALGRHEAASAAAEAMRDRTACRELARDWRQRGPALRRAVAAAAKRVLDLRAQRQGSEARRSEVEEQLANATEAARDAAAHREHLLRQDAAGALRSGLAPGEPCPVCEQTVAVVPPERSPGDALAKAEARSRQCARAESEARDTLQRLLHDLSRLPSELQEAEKASDAAGEAFAWLEQRVAEALGEPADEQAAEKLDALARQAEEAQREASEAMRQWRDAADREASLARTAQHLRHQAELTEQRHADVTASLASSLDRKQRVEEQLGRYRDAACFEQEWGALEVARQIQAGIRDEIASLTRQKVSLDQEAAAADTAVAVSRERLRQAESALAEAEQHAAALRACLDVIEVAQLEQAATAAEQEAARREEERRAIESAQDRIRSRLAEAAALREELAGLIRRHKILRQLHEELHANRFPGFVEAATLRTLAAEGSRHFHELSAERYSFDPTSPDFDVIDHWHAGERRSASTLSGGESFLASLSLALALSESLPRFASRLEALFLDEGFSTLDAATLDDVTSALEKLAGGTRMIGVISHVAELADRLPCRIRVHKSPRGSTLSVDG
ncbi:MAG: SMC family ATPase [Bryobacterales bacterium]|nr:SMC family ATPase [Bryobacterales bacterium]